MIWVKFEIFSKRDKKPSDIFIYNEIPQPFRVQVIHIWKDCIGNYRRPDRVFRTASTSPSNGVWEFIYGQLCREYGQFVLSEKGYDPYEQCQFFILESPVERVLDIIQISFQCIDGIVRSWHLGQKQMAGIRQEADDAIEELNQRLREHALGYQYAGGKVIRLDSQYIYDHAVSPAIQLLTEREFAGASQEFMNAHEHFRHGRYKEAVNEALKSFESTMKTICIRMDWTFSETDTAATLIKTCFSNGLVSPSLQSHFSALKSTLESGLPTIRNKQSGHGQGESPRELPAHVAAYSLHLAATNILFLVKCYESISS